MIGMFSLVPHQLTQSPDGVLWSNAVSTTGILVHRKPIAVTSASTSVEAGAETIVTCTTEHGFAVGDTVTIAGDGSTPTLNGPQVVSGLISSATEGYKKMFKIAVDVTVADSDGGATITPAVAITGSEADDNRITTSAAHGLVAGDLVTIAGHSGSTPSLNGTWKIMAVPTNVTFTLLDPDTGTTLDITVDGTGGTATWFTTIGEITKVTPPGYSRNKVETSTHNDGTESYILGMLRQKDCAFTINYVADDDTHEQLLYDVLNNLKATWKIRFPSGVMFDGPARVSQFQIADAPVDGAQQADLTLAWAGPVVQS